MRVARSVFESTRSRSCRSLASTSSAPKDLMPSYWVVLTLRYEPWERNACGDGSLEGFPLVTVRGGCCGGRVGGGG